MKLNSPLITIVIPTYNRKESVRRLIKSIFDSTYKKIEVIVIDDSSNDGTFEYLKKEFKNDKIRLRRNKKNLFAAGSRNVGLSMAKGEFVFFVDDDNVLEKRTIEFLTNSILQDSTIGEVGPVIYSFKNNKPIWIRARRNMWTSKTYHDKSLGLIKGKSLLETVDIPNAYMIRRDILQNNSIKFRPIFGIMYEESDIAYRIKKLGYKIMVSTQAKIYHNLDEDNFILDPRRPFVFARNRILFHRLYSENLFQFLGIIFFWSWAFALYYIYIIFHSNDSVKLGIAQKIRLSLLYLQGNVVGILNSFNDGKFSKKV